MLDLKCLNDQYKMKDPYDQVKMMIDRSDLNKIKLNKEENH